MEKVERIRSRKGGSIVGRSTVGSDSAYTRQLQSTVAPVAEKTLFLVMHSMMSSNWIQSIIEVISFVLEPLQLAATSFRHPWFRFEGESTVANGLSTVALSVSTVFHGEDFENAKTELIIAMSFVAVVLLTFAYVGFRLTYTSSSPNKALGFLRIIVLFLVSYLFMPSQEVFGKFLLPYQSGDKWLFLVFRDEGEEIIPVLMVFSWIVFIVFAGISTLVVTLAVSTEGFFGQSHGRADMILNFVKTGLVFIMYAQPYIAPSFVLLKVAAALILCWTVLYFLPYNRLVTNQLRSASMMFVLWVTVMETVRVYGVAENTVADILLLGLGPMMLVGYGMVWVRWRRVAARIPSAEALVALSRQESALVQFFNHRLPMKTVTDVDVAVKSVMYDDGLRSRTWAGLGSLIGIEGDYGPFETAEESERQPVRAASVHFDSSAPQEPSTEMLPGRDIMPERIALAHAIFNRGYTLFPESSRLWVSYLNFCHEHHIETRIRLSAATGAKINSLDVRFTFFRYLFEKRRSQIGAGLGTIKYLDLTKSLRTALVYHQKAHKEIGVLWAFMLAGTTAPEKLMSQIDKIGDAEQTARSAFRNLLLHHSYSPQVLRAYAKFLAEIHKNEAEAERYATMAEEMEDEQGNTSKASNTPLALDSHSASSEEDVTDAGSSPRGLVRAVATVPNFVPQEGSSKGPDLGTSRTVRPISSQPRGVSTNSPGPLAGASLPVLLPGSVPGAETADILHDDARVWSASKASPAMYLSPAPAKASTSTTSSPRGPRGTFPQSALQEESHGADPSGTAASPLRMTNQPWIAALTRSGASVPRSAAAGGKAPHADTKKNSEAAVVLRVAAASAGVASNRIRGDTRLTGIRFFRVLLIGVMLATAAFMSIPFAVNITLLKDLERKVRVVVASGRREYLLWTAGQLVADMQSEYLTNYSQYASSIQPCTNRQSDPAGDVLGTVYDVKVVTSNGTSTPTVITSSPPTSDQMQYLLYALDTLIAVRLTPGLVEAYRNVSHGSAANYPPVANVSYTLWSQTLWQSEWVLFNIFSLPLDFARVTAVLQRLANDADQAFLGALVLFACIGLLHFLFLLPTLLLLGLSQAFFERHFGHFLLEAVPLDIISKVAERHTAATYDPGDATELARGASFVDIPELAEDKAEDSATSMAQRDASSKVFRIRPSSNIAAIFSTPELAVPAHPVTRSSVLTRGCCGGASTHKAMCEAELRARNHLSKVASAEPSYRKYRLQLLAFTSLLVAAELVIVILLPVLYTRASLYLREVKAINSYMAILGQSEWHVSLYLGKENRVSTPVLDLGLSPWYDFVAGNPLDTLQMLATQLEFTHRCIVYGCTEMDIEGVHFDADLSDYFYGSTQVDRTLKMYIQNIRNQQFDETFTGYMRPALALTRLLQKLYLNTFLAWTTQYTIAIAVCCSVVIAAVLFVMVRYYKRFILRFTRDVQRYRYVLSLLPTEVLDELPCYAAYTSDTAWASDGLFEITAEQLAGDGEDDQL